MIFTSIMDPVQTPSASPRAPAPETPQTAEHEKHTPAPETPQETTEHEKSCSAPAVSGGVSEAFVHNVDQRAPVVTFRHPRLQALGHPADYSVQVGQHGANSKGFVGNTSSVLWPVALHFSKYVGCFLKYV